MTVSPGLKTVASNGEAVRKQPPPSSRVQWLKGTVVQVLNHLTLVSCDKGPGEGRMDFKLFTLALMLALILGHNFSICE